MAIAKCGRFEIQLEAIACYFTRHIDWYSPLRSYNPGSYIRISYSIPMKPYIKGQYCMITTIPLCDN